MTDLKSINILSEKLKKRYHNDIISIQCQFISYFDTMGKGEVPPEVLNSSFDNLIEQLREDIEKIRVIGLKKKLDIVEKNSIEVLYNDYVDKKIKVVNLKKDIAKNPKKMEIEELNKILGKIFK